MRVKLLHPGARLPTKAHAGDLGFDLYALPDEPLKILPHDTLKVRTGIAVQLPEGYGAFIKERSSLASQGIAVGGGVIDNGYTGEIQVILRETLGMVYVLESGAKIAQLVLVPLTNHVVEEVEDLTSSDGRGDAGFGSTGA